MRKITGGDGVRQLRQRLQRFADDRIDAALGPGFAGRGEFTGVRLVQARQAARHGARMQLDAEAPKREIVIAWRKGSSRGVEGRMLAEVFKDARGPARN